MERHRITPYVALLAILLLAMLICAYTTVGGHDSTLPVVATLPSDINGYEGIDVLYCQNDQCLHSCFSTKAGEPPHCPDCESPLGLVSLPEKETAAQRLFG